MRQNRKIGNPCLRADTERALPGNLGEGAHPSTSPCSAASSGERGFGRVVYLKASRFVIPFSN